ncbi:hypothetical protein FF80_03396 [Devosia sp. LC5]|uniref:esterase-like activity of phytase family protein n=1 Tax=Devosia sp. LC5 TaxID=1502724 RepID=UPI0004E40795|nr:esterase-like activity of phytase family protein [Devosia sp. LC5]KFC62826.1 hypothetical protein FF80_03396 [Devosia sp. LC5]
MKTILAPCLFGLASLIAGPALGQETPFKVELLGSITLPTGLSVAGEEFGGISGLDYDPANDIYYAISDDRSQKAPARFYTLGLKVDAEGVHGVDILASHLLRDAAGNVFPAKGIDPEAIRYNAAARTIFWSTENDIAGNPGVYEARLDGSFLRAFAVPDYYQPAADGASGIYSNLAFESLAISADGATLLAGTENALAQDGDKATLEAGSPSRIISFDIASGQPTAEHVYETGPIHTKATAEPPYNDNGLSELMVFDDTHLLAVERSFAAGPGNEINVYLTDLSAATDINGKPSIKDETVEPAAKQHVFKIGEGDFGLDIDNIESVTFGPQVDGKRTLVIASDNNFNPNGQFTQFVVFTLN